MSDPRNAMTDAVPPVIAAVTLAPGAVIAGRYRLEARLGAGGGGTVWRCMDDALGQVVALKVVGAGGDVERWRREVATARRIAHRNVCRVHDLGETDELRFVTMELVEGDSLRAVIARDVPAAVARDLFAQVVAGAAAIHAAGVVHRDLKPENVVVDRAGRAVIVDFGLAREPRAAGPAVTGAGMVVGTPRYMSPEQAAGQPVDARTDVWALGLLGHELLARALPAADEHGRRVDPSADDAWPGAGAVLRRCLAFLPEERFGDARALAHALPAIAPRRRARWVIGGALLAFAAAIAVAVAVTAQRDAPAAPPQQRPPPVARPALSMLQLTKTEPRKWPAETPVSVALSPDATRLAYTTGNGRVYVRPLAGVAEAWSIPSHEKPRTRPSASVESIFAMEWVIGWFGDGSLAIVASTRSGDYQLDRVYPDGRADTLYRYPQRFAAAVSPVGDRVVVGIDHDALFAVGTGTAPVRLATLRRDDEVLALAWSPDGARLAIAVRAEETGDGALRLLAASGGAATELWRGALSDLTDQLLAWLDDHRVAFASNDLAAQRSRLFTVDVRSRTATLHDEWPGAYVGAGSAARGTFVMLRGTATPAVQIGNDRGRDLERMHDRGVRAGRLAGWTADGRVVFAVGEPGAAQIVRGAAGQAPEPWPGTREGVDVPDTLVADDLIAHHRDAGDQIAIERISPAGARREIARLPAAGADDVAVRCAGDRAPPCVLEAIEGRSITWSRFDPETGARGARIHQRPLRDHAIRGGALSPDGAELAVIDGGDTVTLLDLATGKVASRPGGEGAVLMSLGFAADGDLWVAGRRFGGRLFGLISFRRGTSGKLYASPSSRDSWFADTLRLFAAPRPSPDGTHVAVATLDLALELWRVDGL